MKIRKPSANAALSIVSLAIIVWLSVATHPLSWMLVVYIIGMDVLNVVFWLALPEMLLTNPINNKEEVSNHMSLAE